MEDDAGRSGQEEREEIKLIEGEERRLREGLAELQLKEKGKERSPVHSGPTPTAAAPGLREAFMSKMKPKYAYAAAAFLLISLVLFLPITANMQSVAPGTGGDTYQNLWDIWWVGYSTLTLHTSIWHTPMLYPPLGANLIFQTMSPIGSLLSLPFQALGIVPAYDIMFFLGFVLSGLSMFILAEYLTKNPYAAMFSGLVFTFSAFHIVQSLSHIDWIFIGWVPLSIYFFLKMANGEFPRLNAVGLGLSFMLSQFMGDVEQSMMLMIALALILIVYLAIREKRKNVLSLRFATGLAIFVAVAFVAGSFGYVPIAKALLQPGALSSVNQLNDVVHNQLWSDPLLSFFLPSPYNGLFNSLSKSYSGVFFGAASERISYIGFVALAFAVFALYKKPKASWLWLFLLLVFGWLALGPYVHLGMPAVTVQNAQLQLNSTWMPGLYSLYRAVPVLNIMREPGRFDLMFEVALSALAALGLAALLDSSHKAKRYALPIIVVVSLLYLAEAAGFMTPAVSAFATTGVQVPSLYNALGNVSGNFTVLNIPALPSPTSNDSSLYVARATYFTAISHKPLVGGYLTRQNSSQQEYLFNIPLVIQAYNLQLGNNMSYGSPVNENYTNQTILTLYNYNVGVITVDPPAFTNSSAITLLNYLYNAFGAPLMLNSSIAFLTSNVVSHRIFRSYVAYPILTEWSPQYALLNGVMQPLWTPIGSGAVIVYAPYADTANVPQEIASGASEQVPTKITFSAAGMYGNTVLYVGMLDQLNNVKVIGQFSLTKAMGAYSLNATLLSGPRTPATLLFLTGNSTQNYVYISNITFSRG